MQRAFLIIAAVSGLIAVILGAFGAHALRGKLEPKLLDVFETGVRYQFFHTFALIAVALLIDKLGAAQLVPAGWLFVAGIVLFSGSLYLLAVKSWKWLGPVTPLGGLLFIAGWVMLLIAAARR
jgi:uncharacterized membrane protein YgdD (TMEM256/DUF423 family)